MCCVLKPAMLIISGGVTFFSHGGGEEEYQAWGRQALLVGVCLCSFELFNVTQRVQPNELNLIEPHQP